MLGSPVPASEGPRASAHALSGDGAAAGWEEMQSDWDASGELGRALVSPVKRQ